ncbi:MAG: hypothetical protein VW455_14365 [Nitrospinota bacterium]
MVSENTQQTRFNHEEWMDIIVQFIEAVKQFSLELLRVFKTLLQKGLKAAWEEFRATTPKLSAVDFIFAGTFFAIGLMGCLFIAAGIGLLSYQSFLWLQSGVWTEYPLLTVFNFLFENTPFQQWMFTPESWIGMQKLFLWFLESTPISLALMVPGFSIVFATAGVFTVALVIRFYQLKKM